MGLFGGSSRAAEPERSRRVDEIFADEQHLSPTMRARRAYESTAPTPPRFTEAKPQELDPEPEPLRPPECISLAEARRKLRDLSLAYGERAADADQAKTQRLRDEVLIPWLVRMRSSGGRT